MQYTHGLLYLIVSTLVAGVSTACQGYDINVFDADCFHTATVPTVGVVADEAVSVDMSK